MLWRRGKAYSQDLRERVLAAADDGGSVCAIARRFHVSFSYVSKVPLPPQRTRQTTARAPPCHLPARLAGGVQNQPLFGHTSPTGASGPRGADFPLNSDLSAG